MKTLFDENTRDEMIARIEALRADSPRVWGKMSPAQMMEHTARALEMAIGRRPRKQMFVGKLLSWAFKKEFFGEEPFKQGRPTGKDFIITDEPDLEATRTRLKGLIDEFHGMGEAALEGNVHGFFGSLTGKQWGETQYKHLDHHLRQFGA
ncbi:MAG: DUF1569 domain-containing protein [Chloracidobacterium sp.]|nr:DUF1569 domain-containing protein [Chloracidobacterium sp.]